MTNNTLTQVEANAAGIATDDLIPLADYVSASDSRFLRIDPHTYGESDVRALAEIDEKLAKKDDNGGDWYSGRERLRLERQRVSLAAAVAQILADRVKAVEVQAGRSEPAGLFSQGAT